ncbi:PAS domain protein [Nitrosococcus oceani ATCC 19707]|uniref:PAS domain protein n=2 Tax=Nitrosococcus oceani TaxID=1229 RepID=Q3JB23_NITOC|nr:PAS domain-containing protein [Nitrosococcus oceani]ABA57973.1 PAS domain protein [Nitrosococcus oceani ATCC 19707]EDZ68430.1 PAS domain S-box, putative [Nitrosococcus oceani AFC27]KFI19704.1 diguanylate cyclase [Nitrosococcus oceani C-27]GEM19621.1 diguanylate cyclase [Nitrosococcus oceani]
MIRDMVPEDIVGDYRQAMLDLYGIGPRRILYTEMETPYPDGRLIVSRTDPEGRITHCNQSFVDMSGYAKEELIGVPHSILKHPDIPPTIYKDLWDTLKRGDKWQGFIKNLRKDGGYYWVKATVLPNIRNGKVIGYTSVRRKASHKKIEECIGQYPSLF